MLNKIYKRWFFDNNEKLLISRKNTFKKSKDYKDVILIQTPPDHYFLALYAILISNLKKKNKNLYFVGIYPENFILRNKNKVYFFQIFISFFDQILIKHKWKKLYKKIGINTYYNYKYNNLLKSFNLIIYSFLVYLKLNSKTDLLNLRHRNLYIGDLIYDTYLRFELKPTVDINNFALLKYLYRSFYLYNAFDKLNNYYNVKEYYSSYSTYIQHGIPVRILLEKSITVFTSGNLQQKFKKLTKSDYFHTTDHLVYNKEFSNLNDKENRINEGLSLLKNKFSGEIHSSISYMKNSVFKNRTLKLPDLSNVNGVLFLHDFFDSPHVYDGMLFSDFFDWTIYTLDLIQEYKLKIAIKPHPNQVKESREIISHLQIKYSDLIWLEPGISNIIIFNSNIQFGVSMYGTVLHELAFFGKFAICCGNNPHYAFDFILKPKDVMEYKNMLLNKYDTSKLIDHTTNVAIFYYMHNLYNKEALNYDFSAMCDYNVFNTESSVITDVINNI
jgi:hypothetical protein